MDKEKLQAYFQTHYLSRQEVLFKLPFSVSIENFWTELMNRRKAQARILPLYDSVGKPYWYVLTDVMIAASERLCEEAMNQPEGFDPYRAPMTGAMTEEMFFTSFVEGAQIPLQEAMNFLGQGTEPGNVQEQMLWNNRQAWSAMMKSLFRPLDEQYVKALSFTLTDGMEGESDAYRQSDRHAIVAMKDENYEVPPASVLPERMRDFYVFLKTPDVHPLIKAAVGQAYLLTARPFDEGNERLSRMISYAVLLRSGYDFFRNISISGMIARENYRYYKAMCEILRAENGNDLTYFMEYYIDLLARALTAKKERDREDERAALDAERKLATEPLSVMPQIDELSSMEVQLDSSPLTPGMTVNNPPTMPETEQTGLPPELEELIKKPYGGNAENAERRRAGLTCMIREHWIDIRTQDWMRMIQVDKEAANSDLCWLVNHGLMYSVGRTSNVHYIVAPEYQQYFSADRVIEQYGIGDNNEESVWASSPGESDKDQPVAHENKPEERNPVYENAYNTRRRAKVRERAISHLNELLSNETGTITRVKWMKRFEIDKSMALFEINLLIEAGYLLRAGKRSETHYEVVGVLPTGVKSKEDAPVRSIHTSQPSHAAPIRVPIAAKGASIREAISA